MRTLKAGYPDNLSFSGLFFEKKFGRTEGTLNFSLLKNDQIKTQGTLF
jgi:hypothetical protein